MAYLVKDKPYYKASFCVAAVWPLWGADAAALLRATRGIPSL